MKPYDLEISISRDKNKDKSYDFGVYWDKVTGRQVQCMFELPFKTYKETIKFLKEAFGFKSVYNSYTHRYHGVDYGVIRKFKVIQVKF